MALADDHMTHAPIPGGLRGARSGVLRREAFGHFFVEPLIHVASVLGGLLSQEVIKAVLGGQTLQLGTGRDRTWFHWLA